LFVLGIVAAAFSSADSALTSLTTICCVDLLQKGGDERLRKRVHVLMCVAFVRFILVFQAVNSTSLIDAVYTLVTYTYGPLLGLYTFGLFVKNRKVIDKAVPFIAVASPIISYFLKMYSPQLFGGYKIGFEILIINGLLTFLALLLFSGKEKTAEE
jgi:Na+/proline symporter